MQINLDFRGLNLIGANIYEIDGQMPNTLFDEIRDVTDL